VNLLCSTSVSAPSRAPRGAAGLGSSSLPCHSPSPQGSPSPTCSRGSHARDFPPFPVQFFRVLLLGGFLGLDLHFGSAVQSRVCARVLLMPFCSCWRGSAVLGREEAQLLEEKQWDLEKLAVLWALEAPQPASLPSHALISESHLSLGLGCSLQLSHAGLGAWGG